MKSNLGKSKLSRTLTIFVFFDFRTTSLYPIQTTHNGDHMQHQYNNFSILQRIFFSDSGKALNA